MRFMGAVGLTIRNRVEDTTHSELHLAGSWRLTSAHLEHKAKLNRNVAFKLALRSTNPNKHG